MYWTLCGRFPFQFTHVFHFFFFMWQVKSTTCRPWGKSLRSNQTVASMLSGQSVRLAFARPWFGDPRRGCAVLFFFWSSCVSLSEKRKRIWTKFVFTLHLLLVLRTWLWDKKNILLHSMIIFGLSFLFFFFIKKNECQKSNREDNPEIEQRQTQVHGRKNEKKAHPSTRMGFEPTRAEHNGLAVHRLNHSATSSWW